MIPEHEIEYKVDLMTQHAKKRRSKKTRQSKVVEGTKQIQDENAVAATKYDLSWFKPTNGQSEIIYSECINDLTIVQGSSGCGKSTTAIQIGLKGLQEGRYRHIVFIKTPDECGEDQIGYLSGSENQKLDTHFEAMRSIFYDFMSPQKLELEEKRGNIKFTIPNFIKGKTIYDSLVIIDEGQSISPKTLKLLLERLGNGSKCILLGDKYQDYSAKRRDDGLTHLVNMVTHKDDEGKRISRVDTIGYVELPASENMRSDISKLIVSLYEKEFDK